MLQRGTKIQRGILTRSRAINRVITEKSPRGASFNSDTHRVLSVSFILPWPGETLNVIRQYRRYIAIGFIGYSRSFGEIPDSGRINRVIVSRSRRRERIITGIWEFSRSRAGVARKTFGARIVEFISSLYMKIVAAAWNIESIANISLLRDVKIAFIHSASISINIWISERKHSEVSRAWKLSYRTLISKFDRSVGSSEWRDCREIERTLRKYYTFLRYFWNTYFFSHVYRNDTKLFSDIRWKMHPLVRFIYPSVRASYLRDTFPQANISKKTWNASVDSSISSTSN